MHIYRTKLVNVFKLFPACICRLPFEVSSRLIEHCHIPHYSASSVQWDEQYGTRLWVEDIISKNFSSSKSPVWGWIFIYRLTLSPVESQNHYKTESGPNHNFAFSRAVYIQLHVHTSGKGSRCGYFLVTQFSFSTSLSFLYIFFNFVVGVCFDMLMCRNSLPAVAQGETISKPHRLIRLFLQVHINMHHS